MLSSGMLRRVALVRTDVSKESSASFIRVTRIRELGTTQAETSNRRKLRRNGISCVVPNSPILVALMKEALGSSETSVLTRVTRRNIPEDTILQAFITSYNYHNCGHHPSSYLNCKQEFSEIGFCLRLHVEPKVMGPEKELASLSEPSEYAPTGDGQRIDSPNVLFINKSQCDG
jgi:hypothetical protein